MARLDRIEEGFLGNLAGADLDHVDRFVGAGEEQVHVGDFHVGGGGKHDELAVDPADADGADGTLKGDGTDGQCGRSADHGEDVGVVLAVGGQDEDLDEDFIEITEGEEGADGPVDHAGGEGFLGGGASLAFDEAAGELAGGGGALAVIDGEGEEVGAGAGIGGDGGGEDDGVAVTDEDRAVGLFREVTGFDREGFPVDLPFCFDDRHDSTCLTFFLTDFPTWPIQYICQPIHFRRGVRLESRGGARVLHERTPGWAGVRKTTRRRWDWEGGA